MAKTYSITLEAPGTQANLDEFAHSALFADSITPIFQQEYMALMITSNVEPDFTSAYWTPYTHADDSQSETSIDISTGKFVEGNVIICFATIAEAREDLRDFVTYNIMGSDQQLHLGVCNTTQSQDYTPAMVANSRPIVMLSPAQVNSLGL